MAEETKESDAFFDHFSREDKPTGMGIRLTKALAQRIFDYTQAERGSSILEIGPGRGNFADICLKEGMDYSAIEANRQMAESLKERGASVVQAMVPPLPSLEKQFDIVVMINVMEHMNSMADALQITQQVRDVLKPGGRFVICSPDYLNWRRNFFNCDFSHNYVTTRRRLQQLLINGGFANIRSRYLCGHMTGPMSFLLTAMVSRLPFGSLNAIFPKSKIFYKLYKAQLTFLRKVLILGEKPS
ncbi:MAG: class I SAM-dependent methyltransferase [Planctomycetota bacterium]|jgi:SAM-dependent methyltransferase